MKLVCPACGAVCAAEAFLNDPLAREALVLTAQLPAGVGKSVFSYLGLFRSGTKKSLAWAKTVRLLTELSQELRQEYIQWKHNPARPNSAGVWQMAMEKILENPPTRLPLQSHNYLKAIAYEIADDLDKTREHNIIRAEHSGNRQALQHAKAADQPPVEPFDYEEMHAKLSETKIGKMINMRKQQKQKGGLND